MPPSAAIIPRFRFDMGRAMTSDVRGCYSHWGVAGRELRCHRLYAGAARTFQGLLPTVRVGACLGANREDVVRSNRRASSVYRKLDKDDDQGAADGKAIIVHGFSPAELHAFVKKYRAQEDLPQDVAFAMMTEQSAARPLGDVVAELQQDAKAARLRTKRSQDPSTDD